MLKQLKKLVFKKSDQFDQNRMERNLDKLFSHLETNMHQNIYKIRKNNSSVIVLKERKNIKKFAESAEKISFLKRKP